MANPSISVVAPTYRRRAALPAFVDALLRQDALGELVMAVDGSADGSVEWLRDRARDDERIVVLDLPNRGAGPARQSGIEAASGEVVLLLDDDVVASPGLVAGHLAHHADLEPKLVLGYMPNDWRRLPPGRRGIACIYRRNYERQCARYAREPDFVLHGLWGGNLSMPRRDLLRIGVLGLDVPRGQDDREFGLRCAKAGVRGVFDRSLHAEHLYDRDLDTWRRDSRVQGESRVMLHQAHSDLVGHELSDDPEGPHVADAVATALPRRLRPLVRALARDPLYAPTAATLSAMFAAGVRLRHLGLELRSAQAIGSLETMRGVLERS